MQDGPTKINVSGVPQATHQLLAFPNCHRLFGSDLRKVDLDVRLQVLLQRSSLAMDNELSFSKET
jgi:hypothetical protein